MSSDKSSSGLGIDVVSVNRFLPFEKESTHNFLLKVFSQGEREYCFSYKSPATHLAGIFALKEAVSKALGVKQYPFAEIEIKHTEDGAPEAWHNGEKVAVRVSISHTNDLAIAIAAT